MQTRWLRVPVAVLCALSAAGAGGGAPPLVATIALDAPRGGDGSAPDKPGLYSPGETIVLEGRIRNNSDRPWSIEQRELRCPWTFLVKDARGRPLPSFARVSYGWFPVMEKMVEPGDQVSFRADLCKLYPYWDSAAASTPSLYNPGQYSVQMVLRSPAQEHRPPAGKAWPALLYRGNLRSNILHLEVVEPVAGDVDGYLKDITDLPAEERLKRVNVLGAIGAKQAVDTLACLAAKDQSSGVRAAALEALGRIGDMTPVETVERIVRDDPSGAVRAHAAALLGEWGLRRSVPALIESLKDRQAPSPEEAEVNVWYSAVVKALGDIGDPRATPVLEGIAREDPTPWVRHAAGQSIERIKAGGRKRPASSVAGGPSTTPEPSSSRLPGREPARFLVAGAAALLAALGSVVTLAWYRRRLRKKGAR